MAISTFSPERRLDAWRDTLSARRFLRDPPTSGRPNVPAVIRLDVPRSARALTASPEALKAGGFTLHLAPEIDGNDIISYTLTEQAGGMISLGAGFHPAMAHVLRHLSSLRPDVLSAGDVSQDVIHTYTHAHEAMLSGAFEEAKTLFTTLIDSPGLPHVPWQARFFRGLFGLGFSGGNLASIDDAQAQADFDSVASATESRLPDVAAQALVLAAACAWVGGRDDEAEEYVEAASELDPTLGEAHWLRSRLMLARDQLSESLSSALKAIQIDPAYAIRLASADIMVNDARALNRLLSSLSAELKRQVTPSVKQGLERLRLLARYRPAHADPDVMLLRQVLRRDGQPPIYDLIVLLADRDQRISDILTRFAHIRVLTTHEVEGPEVHYDAIIAKTELRRQKVVTKAGLFGNKEEVSWVEKPFEREYLRGRTARLDTKVVTIQDLTGATLSEVELRRIPAGGFKMGSPPNQPGRRGDETLHTVFLSRPFYIGVTPVTQQLWQAVLQNAPSYFSGKHHPVEQLSWLDAVMFCNALSRLAGYEPAFSVREGQAVWRGPDVTGFRIPTEAEWEYACRAGTQSAYVFGDTLDNEVQAHVVEGEPRSSCAVGGRQSNPFGLYDMHGNVYEWCIDSYGELSSESVRDPVGDSGTDLRVARGGSWDSAALESRAASRAQFSQFSRRATVGLRLALTTDVGAAEASASTP